MRFCDRAWLGPGWQNPSGGPKVVRRLKRAKVWPTAYEASQHAHYGPVYSLALLVGEREGQGA